MDPYLPCHLSLLELPGILEDLRNAKKNGINMRTIFLLGCNIPVGPISPLKPSIPEIPAKPLSPFSPAKP
jgi:hypothetical protein